MRVVSRERGTNVSTIISPGHKKKHFHDDKLLEALDTFPIDKYTVQHTFINMNTAYRGFTMLTGGDGRKRKWPLKNRSHDRKRKWPLKTVT